LVWALSLLPPARAQNDLGDARERDGHWSAARFGGKPEADVEVTALAILACLADGSTCREGPHRDEVEDGARWLCQQQDERGRIGLRTDPDWLRDHALATWVVAEAARLTPMRRLGPPVERAVDVLGDELARRRPPPDLELVVLAELAAQAAQRAGAALLQEARSTPARGRVAADDLRPRPDRRPLADDLHAGVLVQVVAPMQPVPDGSPRQRAASVLLDLLRGRTRAAEAAVLDAWPADPAADALATFYVTWAGYHLGGENWIAISRAISKSGIVRRAGLREAEGAFGARTGRIGQTSASVLTLSSYYRCNRVWFEPPDTPRQ